MTRRLKRTADEDDDPEEKRFTRPIKKEAEDWVNPSGSGTHVDVASDGNDAD